MRYQLVLRYFVNGCEPAWYTVEPGESIEESYAGQGMWVFPECVVNSVEEGLVEAERLFSSRNCKCVREGNKVIESR